MLGVGGEEPGEFVNGCAKERGGGAQLQAASEKVSEYSGQRHVQRHAPLQQVGDVFSAEDAAEPGRQCVGRIKDGSLNGGIKRPAAIRVWIPERKLGMRDGFRVQPGIGKMQAAKVPWDDIARQKQ